MRLLNCITQFEYSSECIESLVILLIVRIVNLHFKLMVPVGDDLVHVSEEVSGLIFNQVMVAVIVEAQQSLLQEFLSFLFILSMINEAVMGKMLEQVPDCFESLLVLLFIGDF